MKRYFIAGGAGFIGSHLARLILKDENDARVTIYDNFSSGKKSHLSDITGNKNLKVVAGDIKDIGKLKNTMKGIDVVYHLASNPDISMSSKRPEIDFWEGTYLTNNLLEAMRANNVRKIFYASGSGVYGDAGAAEVKEDNLFKPVISTYGASKVAGEALISAYCYMFDMVGVSFRFANVVGPCQTHGVGYDFVKKLIRNNRELEILGDGKQSKSYVYITDVINALRLVERNTPERNSYYNVYNVATLDYLKVKEIAGIALDVMGLKNVKFRYAGGRQGWKGDVPVVRMNSAKIRKLGWRNRYNCAEAVRKSIESIFDKFKKIGGLI